MIDLSIIIVSYNTKEFLKKCLLSIVEHGSGRFAMEVIVVDNYSTDGSVEVIQSASWRTKLKIIKNTDNLGFSKANNIGVKNSRGRYVLFLNSDTIVYPKTLETMVDFMDHCQDAGAATCKVMMLNKRIDDACHRGLPTPWNAFCHFLGLSKSFPKSRFFNGYNLGWMSLEKTHEIDACCGAFMIVRREAGEETGWWDEDYFWYGEDLDFCYRLKEKGWKIYFVPTVSILHYKGVSGGIKSVSKHLTTADKETRIRATRARFEAMRIFYDKNYKNKYPRIITWLVHKGISLKEKSILL